MAALQELDKFASIEIISKLSYTIRNDHLPIAMAALSTLENIVSGGQTFNIEILDNAYQALLTISGSDAVPKEIRSLLASDLPRISVIYREMSNYLIEKQNIKNRTENNINEENIYSKALLAISSGDVDQAHKLLDKKAENGDMQAQYYLGKLYSLGNGSHINYKKSELWFSKAAKNNHVASQDSLARLYLTKNTSIYDEKKGLFWMNTAAANGSKFAKDWLAKYSKFYLK